MEKKVPKRGPVLYPGRRVSPPLKKRVVALLREQGVQLLDRAEVELVRYQAEMRLLPAKPRESNQDYFLRVLVECSTAKPPRYKGKIVPPRVIDRMASDDAYVMPLPDNPRAAQILDLPRPISMGGVGNWRKFTDWCAREGL